MTQKATGANDAGHITANASTTLKSGPCVLLAVTVNSKGSGNTATVYDSKTGSGKVLAVIDTTQPGTFAYNAQLDNGLTIVTAGGTAADITVSYT